MNISQNTIKKIQKLTGAKKLTLGTHIAAIRQGEEWSQAELARKLMVSRQFICDLEHNRRMLSPVMAEKFAIKLGYSPQQFVRLCLQDMLENQGLNYTIELDTNLKRPKSKIVA